MDFAIHHLHKSAHPPLVAALVPLPFLARRVNVLLRHATAEWAEPMLGKSRHFSPKLRCFRPQPLPSPFCALYCATAPRVSATASTTDVPPGAFTTCACDAVAVPTAATLGDSGSQAAMAIAAMDFPSAVATALPERLTALVIKSLTEPPAGAL